MLWLNFFIILKSTRFCVVQIDEEKSVVKNAEMTDRIENAMMRQNRISSKEKATNVLIMDHSVNYSIYKK